MMTIYFSFYYTWGLILGLLKSCYSVVLPMNFMSISCLLFCFYIFPQAARRYYSYIVIMWCGDGSVPKIINKVPCRVMGGGEKTGRWQLWSWWCDNKGLNGGNGWGHTLRDNTNKTPA